MNCLVLLLVLASIDKISSVSTAEEDCAATETCSEEVICKKGYILNSNKTNCLPYITQYYGECSEDAQCTNWLGPHGVCRGSCVCKDGYRWIQGDCKSYVGLGGSCGDDSDCFDGYNLQSLTCLEGTCNCSDGYYQRGQTDCRKIASGEGDICALDIDCQFENGTCIKGICSTSSKLLLKEEEIEQTFFNSQLHDQQKCDSDEDCAAVLNSECYEETGTCVCKKAYFFNKNGTECIPELGVFTNCTDSSDCQIKPSKCEDGVCYCRDYYFVDDSNRNCVKTMSQQNWNCLSREWCYALGKYSFCSSTETCNCSKGTEYDEENVLCLSNGQNGTDPECVTDYDCRLILNSHCVNQVCECEEYYEREGDKCVLLEHRIGFPCSNETECAIENSECTSGTCQCVEKYVTSSQNVTCYPIKQQLGEECEIDMQCSLSIAYSGCVNTTCGCLDNYLSHNNYCYEKKDYNSYCNNLMECSLSLGEGFQCRNRMCQCPTGMQKDEDGCSSGNGKNVNFFVIAFVLILKGIFSVFC